MEDNKSSERIGLALSGGGYRAAAYHLGTFKKLKELGLLNKIDVFSSNSGGSITTACYALHHEDFNMFEKTVLDGLKESVVLRALLSWRFWIPAVLIFSILVLGILLLFTYLSWVGITLLAIVLLLMLIAQFSLFPTSYVIEGVYDDIFYHGKKLGDFSELFEVAILSTNLSTGRPFTFSRGKMTDSSYEYPKTGSNISFNGRDFPVARAVMASTCVPGVFSPVRIHKRYFAKVGDAKRVNPCLVDGGVYDNQGIHKVTFRDSSFFCHNVIVSDAGTMMPEESSFQNSLSLLIRTSAVLMNRVKNFQMQRSLFEVPNENKSVVAYQSLGFDVHKSIQEFLNMLKAGYISDKVMAAHRINQLDVDEENWESIRGMLEERIDYQSILRKSCSNLELEIARSIRTNLTPLSETEINVLIKHAMNMTEIQVKLFCPHILDDRL